MTNNEGFFDRVTADGSSGFPAEAGRYHLYISLGCPFAQRAFAVLIMKGLEKAISYTVTDVYMIQPVGWKFTDSRPKCSLDTVNGCETLKEIYLKANPNFSGRVTVPALWDKVKKTIVNNDSRQVMEILNSEFNAFAEHPELDLYPTALRKEIDELFDLVAKFGSSAYACGFATTQETYDTNVTACFNIMDELDKRLASQRYLLGKNITLADIALYALLIRFDWVFNPILKCDKKRLIEYEHLWPYTRDLYQSHRLGSIVDKDHIRLVPLYSYKTINPSGVASVGPDIDFAAPHNRSHL